MDRVRSLQRISFIFISACVACQCTSIPENTTPAPGGSGEDEDLIHDTESNENCAIDDENRAEDTAPGGHCQEMRVVIPPHEFQESDIAYADLDYLNALATEYVCSLAGATLDPNRFLYGWAPTTLFNEIIEGNTEDIPMMRWIFHLSGHFGGLWLHNGLDPNELDPNELDPNELDPNERQDAGLDTDAEQPPGGMDFALLNAEKIARQAIAALEGPDVKLFEYSKDTLLAFLLPNLGMAWNFGYNRGYLLEIYLRPPQGIAPPPNYVSCKGALWCDYGVERVPILASLRDVSSNLDSKGGRWKELREGSLLNPLDGIKAAQNAGNKMGQMVWGSFFDKSDMAEPEFYLGLLHVSASFLAVVQTAGLLSARGYAERDLESARQGALIQSGLGYWLAAYMKSFGSGSTTPQPLPTIVPAGDLSQSNLSRP